MVGGGRDDDHAALGRAGGRATALTGVLLALVLVGGALVARSATSTDGPSPTSVPILTPSPTPTPTPSPTSRPTPAPTSRPPRPGSDHPVRRVGPLAGRTRIVSGEGNAELRYTPTPGQPTRFHLICTGCDADTWLVAWPRHATADAAAGAGLLADPADATGALDVAGQDRTTRLLLRAAAGASWTLTLTPFDAVPVHRASFDGLDDDVVAVQATGTVRLRCTDRRRVQTLARAPGRRAYVVVETLRGELSGTSSLRVPDGAGLLVVVVSCRGRWSLALP